MEPVELNVGFAGFSADLVDTLENLNNLYPHTRVTEVFGSLKGMGRTARADDRLPVPTDLIATVRRLEKAGISLKWTLNFSSFGGTQDFDWPFYKDLVAALIDAGVTRFIVSLPLVCWLVKECFPETVVEVSTIARVDSIKALRKWFELGADGICWDVMENRNLQLLGAGVSLASQQGKYIEVLVNEFCTFDCIYRNHCYDLSSHNSEREAFGGYPFAWCISERALEPWQWIAARFVLPEHLDFYAGIGVKRFKISGRTWPWSIIAAITEHYMKRSSPDNLLSLWPHVNPLVGDLTEPESSLVIPAKPELARKEFLERFWLRNCSIHCQTSCFYCNRLASRIARRR